ncbi:Septal ring factor EnvC, activator of murein hydrolases AmiA and AmiB [Flavobacterium micromati]|uniref:Septal ring factor EnvC, activator of murein hydrolases AmiA and AmiB n=1 Tax=Flavobacterium micromati TaxID=229205 RepID=A0A1M5Q3X6_9FLAO|nr:peptidoglycan DD-metalloendopeptidase family protein [Flavobacterium micromati]MCL6460734.1 peptidoglycan DD-metalloendopeptidase family protein [Flavobacterium micromati]SHH08748.1 Septal ring factor EnvC, activator of murein hydrolases AmiA and AmiB [Flavobacterium micromati]
MPKFLLSLIFICMTSLLWSQDSQQEKLEERKAQIQKEIRENEKLLQSVKKKEKSAVNVVIIQSTKIKLKEKLINTTEKQTKLLSNDMYINQMQINKLKRELLVLKEDYAKMIVKSYKSRSTESRAMFILSSESFLQAYKRAQYMKQYTGYRKMQGEEIKVKSDKLSDFNDKLSVQKIAKQKLIAENVKERLSLEKEKQQQVKLVNVLKKDKNKIAKEIGKKQQEYRTIDRQINKLIREAIAAANRKAALEKAKANPGVAVSKTSVSSSKIELTPEAKIIADNFRANRGRLPYPVEKGYISLGYGNQTHPLFNTITVHNSGVEITTDRGATARAVFGGEVASVIILSPVNRAVMIQHGDYFTVYQNLSSVSVSKGDKVNIKQSIGTVRTNGETGRTIIKFLILQNTSYNDPEGWLSGR